MLDSNKVLNADFSYLRKGEPVDILKIPLEQGAWTLDALWGMFAATGSKLPIKRIASALPWVDIKGNINKLMIGGAANWSLTSNAVQHKQVYSILSEMYANSPDNMYLSKVLNNADKELRKRTEN